MIPPFYDGGSNSHLGEESDDPLVTRELDDEYEQLYLERRSQTPCPLRMVHLGSSQHPHEPSPNSRT